MHRLIAPAGRLLVLLLALPLAAAPAAGDDLAKAKAYLDEVKTHLLEHYADADKLKAAALTGAAIRAMSVAMDQGDFSRLDAEKRAAVKKALEAKDLEIASALDAASEAAEGIDLIRLADHAATAMVKVTGDPFSRLMMPNDLRKLMGQKDEESPAESLGLGVGLKEGKSVVIFLRYGFAAEDEGIELGDEVVSVNGRATDGHPADEVNSWFHAAPEGKERSEIVIRRAGVPDPVTFEVATKPGKPR